MMKLTASGKVKAKTDHGTARKQRREKQRRAVEFQIRMLEGKLRAKAARMQERLTVKRDVTLPNPQSVAIVAKWQATHAYVHREQA